MISEKYRITHYDFLAMSLTGEGLRYASKLCRQTPRRQLPFICGRSEDSEGTEDMSKHDGHKYNDPAGANADKRTAEYKKLNQDK